MVKKTRNNRCTRSDFCGQLVFSACQSGLAFYQSAEPFKVAEMTLNKYGKQGNHSNDPNNLIDSKNKAQDEIMIGDDGRVSRSKFKCALKSLSDSHIHFLR